MASLNGQEEYLELRDYFNTTSYKTANPDLFHHNNSRLRELLESILEQLQTMEHINYQDYIAYYYHAWLLRIHGVHKIFFKTPRASNDIIAEQEEDKPAEPSAQALFMMGLQYLSGLGKPCQPQIAGNFFNTILEHAEDLLDMPANSGPLGFNKSTIVIHTKLILAQMLYKGRGVASNTKLAVEYLESLAKSGEPIAQYLLACLLRDGYEITKNLSLAAEYYCRSAEQGSDIAQRCYGEMLENGYGIRPDHIKAAYFYQLSAQQGNPIGQYLYAKTLEQGRGVPLDLHGALYYYFLSAVHLYEEAETALEALSRSGNIEAQYYFSILKNDLMAFWELLVENAASWQSFLSLDHTVLFNKKEHLEILYQAINLMCPRQSLPEFLQAKFDTLVLKLLQIGTCLQVVPLVERVNLLLEVEPRDQENYWLAIFGLWVECRKLDSEESSGILEKITETCLQVYAATNNSMQHSEQLLFANILLAKMYPDLGVTTLVTTELPDDHIRFLFALYRANECVGKLSFKDIVLNMREQLGTLKVIKSFDPLHNFFLNAEYEYSDQKEIFEAKSP